ncbi:hypothetical protein [Cytobacillus oceanisediminis]|uniref:hypothetical protein n=1 Tax=Cytobacillus oceanisediminis TaxID=665099 RepID=UPI001C2252E7|nr:hypothetical protein [Cytobacillus oceanisediminis]MBU8773201.1 hypothetical protein [Cytobacillus oceanisediminis]
MKSDNLKLHLIYLSIIFVVITLGLLSLIFVDSVTAIGTLSYASTLLSIVLAVIAILITLWDVAGQKNSILEIKEQSKILKETVDEFQKSNSDAEGVIHSIKELQNSFVEEIRKTQQLSFKTLEGLEKLKNSKDEEEKEKIVNDLENNIKLNLTEEQKNNTAKAISFYQKHMKIELKRFIKDHFGNKYFKLDEAKQEYYGITRDRLATSYLDIVIQDMLDKGELYVNPKDNDLYYKMK